MSNTIPSFIPAATAGVNNFSQDPFQKSFANQNPNFAVQIAILNSNIANFISQCDAISNQLSSARNTELLDMSTSNSNLVGYGISMISNAENHAVADRLDSLQREAVRINSLVGSIVVGVPMTLPLLDTNFNGYGIRRAENAEHSLFNTFFDVFGNGIGSSIDSARTVREIQHAANKVYNVRSQAQSLLSSVNILTNLQATMAPQMPIPPVVPPYVPPAG